MRECASQRESVTLIADDVLTALALTAGNHLTAVKLATELLRRAPDTSRNEELCTRVDRHVDALSILVAEFLRSQGVELPNDDLHLGNARGGTK